MLLFGFGMWNCAASAPDRGARLTAAFSSFRLDSPPPAKSLRFRRLVVPRADVDHGSPPCHHSGHGGPLEDGGQCRHQRSIPNRTSPAYVPSFAAEFDAAHQARLVILRVVIARTGMFTAYASIDRSPSDRTRPPFGSTVVVVLYSRRERVQRQRLSLISGSPIARVERLFGWRPG